MIPVVESLKNRAAWVRWTPDPDTAAAAGSVIAMIPLYYLSVHLSGWPGTLAVFVQMVLLGVLFPVWWIAWHRKKSLADLGITRKHALAGLAVGIVLACLFAQPLLTAVSGPAVIPHLLVNACMFWEPFFVFGWLFLAFDRAFGIVPGILGTALAFAAYHLGTYPPSGLAMLFIVGLAFGGIFCAVKNILVLWPFAWTVSSAIGTAMGGMIFSWADLPASIAVLAVSLAVIAYTIRAAPKMKKD
jgi:membrane protease YdiL (CAAX protease family)